MSNVQQKKIKVLVADDEAGIRDLIKYLLEPLGYDVVTVRDGQEAVDIVSTKEFDIIFLDIHMPKMRGTEALDQIRKLRPSQAVVIFSSSSDPFYVFESQARQRGAFDCMYKPFELEDLIKIIDKAVVHNGVN
jgi:CheY-like chemotaxis protein